MNLSDSISEIPGVGPKYKRLLNRLEIHTIEDLLLHVPFKYDDLSQIKKISELTANTFSTVVGTITYIENIFTRNRKRLTKATLEDETGKLNLLWFNQHYIKRSLSIGTKIAVSGKLNERERTPQFLSPNWETIKGGKLLHTGGLIPVYPSTDGITQKWLRAKIKYVIENIQIPENLPDEIIVKNKLIGRKDAINFIHFPEDLKLIQTARKRLSFEELLFLHINGLKQQTEWTKKKNSHKITIDDENKKKFLESLPFKLTRSQERSAVEILNDLKANIPMNRLLQGDVGSGKTVVATLALLAANKSGLNAIFIAPTQILAQQHFKTIKNFLRPFEVEIKLLTSNSKLPKNGNNTHPYLIIGTHAILHNLDSFGNIGLIVIDEQHKFGVKQRSKIIDHYSNKLTPNLLTMTATPIPRSLALTFYGNLKLSTIDEIPEERKKVKTIVISEAQREKSYGWILKKIKEDKIQVFIVCPFIEPSQFETLQNVRAAEEEYEKIKKIFKGQKTDLLHGKLKKDQKNKVIHKFYAGKTDILVTTPVIEVGVDIPNANIIIVETPERFGLASLHQLRGRVGRGEKQGYCILIASTTSRYSFARLKNLETVYNGNKLSEIDMKIRGPGNIYGTEQHGFLKTKVADITDIEMVAKTKNVAKKIFINLSKYPKIKTQIENYERIAQN